MQCLCHLGFRNVISLPIHPQHACSLFELAEQVVDLEKV